MTNLTAAAKRKQFQSLINGSKTFVIAGAFDAMCAKFVQKHHFPCTYVSGSATAASLLGLPDLGMTTLTEAAREAGYIANAVNIPTLADADTGFGELINIPRTITEFESKGLSGIHLEDQVFPKRCGHLSGKDVIPESEMVAKIKAAVAARNDKNFMIIARVDAYSVNGFDDMVHRAQAYADAGVDMIFPEAMTSLAEYEKVVKTVSVPILANMTEFGKTPYIRVKQFAEVGCRCVLFPLTIFRAAMKTMDKTLDILKREGSQEPFLDEIYTRQDFYDLIDYPRYEAIVNQAIKK